MSKIIKWAIKTDLNSIEKHIKKATLSESEKEKGLECLNEIRKIFDL